MSHMASARPSPAHPRPPFTCLPFGAGPRPVFVLRTSHGLPMYAERRAA
ncbi:MAG: hypothetical protein IT317_18655 [Anaerolineales bacterium]|nr:hypothetical protein [Anaerolineales bacterium]